MFSSAGNPRHLDSVTHCIAEINELRYVEDIKSACSNYVGVSSRLAAERIEKYRELESKTVAESVEAYANDRKSRFSGTIAEFVESVGKAGVQTLIYYSLMRIPLEWKQEIGKKRLSELAKSGWIVTRRSQTDRNKFVIFLPLMQIFLIAENSEQRLLTKLFPFPPILPESSEACHQFERMTAGGFVSIRINAIVSQKKNTMKIRDVFPGIQSEI